MAFAKIREEDLARMVEQLRQARAAFEQIMGLASEPQVLALARERLADLRNWKD